MTHQKYGAVVCGQGGGEVDELLHQVRPVVGHGVARVVAKFFNRFDAKAACAQRVEHDAVSAGGKAVAVSKNNEGLGHA